MALTPFTTKAAGPDSIGARIADLDHKLLTARAPDRVQQLSIAYQNWRNSNSADGTCSTLSDEMLHEAFLASARISTYLANAASLSELQCPYYQLVKRNIAGASEHKDMYGALVQNRKFNEANILAGQEGIPTPRLPDIIGNNPHKQGTLQALEKGSVEWHPWKYKNGKEIIAYVSPSCGFSRQAMNAMADDPTWNWIRPNIRFVVRRSYVWPYPGLNEWNLAHPGLPMQNQAGPTGWESLEIYETPVFLVYQQGKLIKKITGWADSGAELAAMKDYFKQEID